MNEFLEDNSPRVLSVTSELHKCLKIMGQLALIFLNLCKCVPPTQRINNFTIILKMLSISSH